MPILHNPTDTRLACYDLGLFLTAGERIKISEREAELVRDSPIFVVEDDPKPAPVRKTVKRGGKRAEVSSPPKRETR